MSQEISGNYQSGCQRAAELVAAGEPLLMADCSGAD